jgi:cation transport ATPase
MLIVSVALAFVTPLLKDGTYSVLLAESALLAVVFFALSNTLFFLVGKSLGVKSALNRALSLTCMPYSGDDLEKIASSSAVVFDEPGVLKEESIKIDRVYLSTSFKGKITKLIKDYSLTLSDIAKKDEISVTIGSNTLYCATYEKFLSNQISVENEVEDDGVKYLAINNKYVGAITLSEGIKRDAYGAIRELKDEGVSSIILTDEVEAFETLKNVANVESLAGKEAFLNTLDETTVYVANKKANENASVNVVFDSMGKIFKYKNSLVIANGQPKSVAKVIKLFKRLKKFEKNTLVASLLFKALAFVSSFVLFVLSTMPQAWIPVSISTLIDCICLLVVFKNDSEV